MKTSLILLLTVATALTVGAGVASASLFGVDTGTDELVRIDPTTGAVTVVGLLGMDARDIDLTRTADGTLWGLNSIFRNRVDLWTIDPLTGAVTSSSQVPGIVHAEGLGHVGNQLKIGYSSAGTARSDLLGDLSASGIISNPIGFTASTGFGLDFDGLSFGAGGVPFYALDRFHTGPGPSDTSLFEVDPTGPTATRIGDYNSTTVVANDLIPQGGKLFLIDNGSPVLHRVDAATGLLEATISLNRVGTYLGLSTAPPLSSVPEPATIGLLCLGLAALGLRRLRF